MLMIDTWLQLHFEQEIGQEGRNSNVYIAHDPQLNAHLVAKQIKKNEFSNPQQYFTEAQMLYSVEHPNIMNVRYSSQDQENVYITMDYYKNGSLSKLMESRYLTVREIVKFGLEFLSGIHFMHTKNLVHFDIKPNNILINDSNQAVVTDFGLAKYLNEYGFELPEKLYPLHVPPERFEFGAMSKFSDVYQAGLTLYRMCNGDDFFKNQLSELGIKTSNDLFDSIHNEKFPKKHSYLPHIPKKMQKLINIALETNVEKRYQDVLELINALSEIDKNLDWRYNEFNDSHLKWEMENDTHLYHIELNQTQEGKWDTVGYRTNIESGSRNRVTKWCHNGYNNKEEAFKQMQKYF